MLTVFIVMLMVFIVQCCEFVCAAILCVYKTLFPGGHVLPLAHTLFLPSISQWSQSLGRRGVVYMFCLGLRIEVTYFLIGGCHGIFNCWG